MGVVSVVPGGSLETGVAAAFSKEAWVTSLETGVEVAYEMEALANMLEMGMVSAVPEAR
jgi:hypothetical protein